MARTYYFNRPLSEVLERRKGYHLNATERALDKLYSGSDAERIERFETALLDLTSRASKLERKVSRRTRTSTIRTPKEDPRPKIDFETYVKARNAGLIYDDIRAWFQIDSPRQLAAFNATYSRNKAKYKRRR